MEQSIRNENEKLNQEEALPIDDASTVAQSNFNKITVLPKGPSEANVETNNKIEQISNISEIVPPSPEMENNTINEVGALDNIIEDVDNSIPTLTNPHLDNLDYVQNEVSIHANLYEIKILKDYIFYEYSVAYIYDGWERNPIATLLKRKILAKAFGKNDELYGPFIGLGDAFYAMNEVKDFHTLSLLFHNVDYKLEIKPTNRKIEMSSDPKKMIQQYTDGKNDIKTIFEVIVREILTHNPSLNYVMSLFGYKDEERILQADKEYNNINIMPGYSTKVMIFESGIYLNVDIKTKIVSNYNVLQLIETFPKNMRKPTKKEIQDINDYLKGKTIETTHTHQRFIIEEVNFDRNPKTCTIKQNKESVNLVNHFKECYGLDVNPNSPLLFVKKKIGSKQGSYLPPEHCVIVGLDDEKLDDRYLVQSISKMTKMKPDDKINLINDIVKLVNEKKPIVKTKIINGTKTEIALKSSFNKKEEFGIDIVESKEKGFIKGKVMTMPKLIGKKGEIQNVGRPFKVYSAKPINSICLFLKKLERDARSLHTTMLESVKDLGIIFKKFDFKHVDGFNLMDWKNLIAKCIRKDKYNVIVFLIDDLSDDNGLYDLLKAYLQEEKGVLSQFIKAKSLRKNAMSICSNIAIQINTKLGGISYVIDFGKEIKEKHLMIVGVDSSGYENNGKFYQSISLCATLDNDFGQYTNEKTTVEFENYDNANYPVAGFIEKALAEFFKLNKQLPGGVIFYRQGISKEQKKYFTYEIEQTNKILNGQSELKCLKGYVVPYYYVFVNKKSSLKFFEMDSYNKKQRNSEKGIYDNPDCGLLIYDEVVNPNKFEFYIQPQKVTQGTATPTCFQVEYGNMNCPHLLPKLTYDLCYLYSNWRGPVRVPAPLKYAEKLAKSKAGINENIKNTLSYI